MAIKTQGTHIYIVDPDETEPVVITVQCAISASGLNAARDQLESTCLESSARTYEPGLATPGQMSMTLNFDPSYASHTRIYELWQAGTKFELAIGLSDGTAAADVDSDGEFDLPTSRSFFVCHDAYFADVPIDLALNALVTANVSIQLSGFPDLFEKA